MTKGNSDGGICFLYPGGKKTPSECCRNKRCLFHPKRKIIFQPFPTLIFELPCSEFYGKSIPYGLCPGLISIYYKWVSSSTAYISLKKIDLPPAVWPPNMIPDLSRGHPPPLFWPTVNGGWFPLGTSVLCHWRMGPSLPGRKKSGSVRAMTTVASVMSSGS